MVSYFYCNCVYVTGVDYREIVRERMTHVLQVATVNIKKGNF